MKLDTVFDTDDEVQFLYAWFFKRDKTLIDNIVFYLHYHVTTALFLVGCLIVTVSMYIMDPIDCIADKAVDDVIDNFCLYHSTYTIAGGSRENLSVHPGVSANLKASGETSKIHNYYLWVALVLVIQASFFYIPRGLWKAWEGSRVQTVLNVKNEIFSPEEETESDYDEEIEEKATRVMANTKWHRFAAYILSKSHKFYYLKLLFCESLNLINAILQLVLMDMFLGFSLFHLNLDVFQLFQDARPSERTNAVELVFPKVTACTFFSYGPSGNVVNYEALCVLPVNAINEKIFGTLYFWLMFLVFISCFAVLYRLLFLIPVIRKIILKGNLNSDETVLEFKKLPKELSIGHWQLLCQLGGNRNIDSWEFTTIVKSLCEHCTK